MSSKSKTTFVFWGMLIFVVLIGLNACQGQSTTPIPYKTVPPLPTITHNNPTPTVTISLQTATPTLERVKPSDTPTKNNGPIILEELPGDVQLSGTIMLFHDGVREFIDLKKGNQFYSKTGRDPNNTDEDPFWGHYMFSPRLSPDGKWFAEGVGYGTGYFNIKLTSTDNWKTIISKYLFWYPALGWVNNDTLYVIEPNHQYGKPDRAWLFNPFTSEIRAFSMDYPYLAIGDERIGLKELRFRYSPDMTRLVYYGGEGLNLWDEENETLLGSFQTTVSPQHFDLDFPIWRSDSGQWLYLSRIWTDPKNFDPESRRTRIVIIDRDGNLLAQMPQDFRRIDQFAWSLDGNKVAFIYTNDKKTPPSLGIWDISTGQMMLDCLQLSNTFTMFTWSPDDEYLAIGRCDVSCAKKREVLLMSVKDGWIAHWMGEDYYVEAWIDKSQ